MDTGKTNYLRPFLNDIGKAVDTITGKRPQTPVDAGTQLMGSPTELQRKSTEGSPAFSKAELKQGYRKVK